MKNEGSRHRRDPSFLFVNSGLSGCCKQKFERQRTCSVPPLLNANMKIYEGKALVIRSAFTSECPSISKIRGVKGRGIAAKRNWRSLHTQSGRWKGCFSSNPLFYNPSVIGAEDICERSHSCTDATSPSHLKYLTAFGTRFASAERIILT